MGRKFYGWMGGHEMYGCMLGGQKQAWVAGTRDGRMDQWVDKWMNGKMDEWMLTSWIGNMWKNEWMIACLQDEWSQRELADGFSDY